MNESLLSQALDGGWVVAALRIAFIGLVYLFLYLVLRATAGDLAATVRTMTREGLGARLMLVIEDGASSSCQPGEAWQLLPVTTIGRDADNAIVVDDPHVSAHHAELRFERGQWWLRDLDSSNGTRLNGEPVRAVVAVRHGDVLQCGRVRFSLAPSFAVPAERPSA